MRSTAAITLSTWSSVTSFLLGALAVTRGTLRRELVTGTAWKARLWVIELAILRASGVIPSAFAA